MRAGLGVPFSSDENLAKLTAEGVARICEYTQTTELADCRICELYLKKAAFKDKRAFLSWPSRFSG